MDPLGKCRFRATTSRIGHQHCPARWNNTSLTAFGRCECRSSRTERSDSNEYIIQKSSQPPRATHKLVGAAWPPKGLFSSASTGNRFLPAGLPNLCSYRLLRNCAGLEFTVLARYRKWLTPPDLREASKHGTPNLGPYTAKGYFTGHRRKRSTFGVLPGL